MLKGGGKIGLGFGPSITNLKSSTPKIPQLTGRLSSSMRVNPTSPVNQGPEGSTGSSESRLYSAALRNVNEGISLSNIITAAVEAQSSILSQMHDLAKRASDINTTSERRRELSAEFKALKADLTRIEQSTEFNGTKVLLGDKPQGVKETWVQADALSGSGGAYAIVHPDSLMGTAAEGKVLIDPNLVMDAETGAQAINDALNAGVGAVSWSLGEVESFFNTDQFFVVEGTNGGSPRDVLLVPYAQRTFDTGETQIVFMGLEASTVTPGNWDTIIAPIDALRAINVKNDSSLNLGRAMTMTFDASGAVIGDKLSNASLDHGTVINPLDTSKYSLDAAISIRTRSSALAAISSVGAMQNNRLAALGMAEADKNRLGMTLEFVSNVRAQDRDLGEPITEPAQAERVIGSVAKQVLENSDLALAASANQSFKNVVSLLINVDTSPAKT